MAFLALVSLRKTLILEACMAPTTLSHPSTFAWRRAYTYKNQNQNSKAGRCVCTNGWVRSRFLLVLLLW